MLEEEAVPISDQGAGPANHRLIERGKQELAVLFLVLFFALFLLVYAGQAAVSFGVWDMSASHALIMRPGARVQEDT